MHLFHPSRPRLPNNLPCWLTAPLICLPRPVIELHESDPDRLGFVVNGSFKWVICWGLEATLERWVADPEKFAADHLGGPQQSLHKESTKQTAPINLSDLGL